MGSAALYRRRRRKVVARVESSCRSCGGALRQAAVLANYKSFVISLMRCEACGATSERKENAHRPSGPSTGGRAQDRDIPRPARHTPTHLIPDPSQAPPAPAPPAKRHKPAKKLQRPFNIRVTRRKP